MSSIFQIYGKKNCSNCDKIKKICIDNKKDFEYQELEIDFKRSDFEWFWKNVEIKEYPIIRYKGIYISYHLFNKVYLDTFLSV